MFGKMQQLKLVYMFLWGTKMVFFLISLFAIFMVLFFPAIIHINSGDVQGPILQTIFNTVLMLLGCLVIDWVEKEMITPEIKRLEKIKEGE